jgi:3-hydroxymyristoyl/3-hydroxydecanoyl-(acyl carrier protein) dehydratase
MTPRLLTGAAVAIKGPLYTRAQLESTFLPINRMLQIDRVTDIDGDLIVSEVDIPDHWVFPMHFPLDPIFPGSLLMEAAGQTMAMWAWNAGIRGRPRLVKIKARFETCVVPADHVIRLIGKVRQRKRIFSGVVELFVSQRKVAEIQPMLIIIPTSHSADPNRAFS